MFKALQRPILLLLSVPPPYGGGEMLGSFLQEYFSNNSFYKVYAYSRCKSNKSIQGKPTLYNFLWGFYLIIKSIFLITFYRPRVVYVSLPKDYIPFLRTAIIISAAKLFSAKVLGELPGANFPFLDRPGFKKSIGLHVLRKIDSIRVLGPSIMRYMANFHLNNCVSIDNGVFVPVVRLPKQCPDKQVPLSLIYIGALEFSKGLYNSIQALALARQAGLSVHFHLLGEWAHNDQKNEIIQYISNNNLAPWISLHGLLTLTDKWEIICKSDVLLHPTFWDGQPLTILEAMGCGLAIITTPVGAIPDTVEHEKNGTILTENTPESIYKAIKYYYENRDAVALVARNNVQTFLTRFTLERYLSNMQNWFESFLPQQSTDQNDKRNMVI